jgi:hypothetical protein
MLRRKKMNHTAEKTGEAYKRRFLKSISKRLFNHKEAIKVNCF